MNKLLRETIIYGVGVLIIYISLFIYVDKSTIFWVHNNFNDSLFFTINKWISFSASSSIFFSALVISFLFILILDRKRKSNWTKSLFMIWTTIALAMLIGGVLKIILARCRPIMLLDDNLYGLRFFSMKWIFHSTPSGHTLRAFALFTSLAIIDNKRKFLYLLLALCVGMSRIVTAKHFPSDILFGAYVGIFSSYWVNLFFIKWGYRFHR